jgi:two-component system, chemotaxis family, protein-glutamate methylesterase/glutaminase
VHGTARPRVVVADDSSFMRRLLASALSQHGCDVIGVAEDGEQALALCAEHRPDVLTLDLAMPGVNGLDVLRSLRANGSSIPVVVVSAFSPAFGVRAIDTLAEGAFELVAKPAAGEPIDEFIGDLRDKVTLACHAARTRSTNAGRPVALAPARPRATHTKRAVVIACSTGGPRALATIVPQLPAPLGKGMVIVQHMPRGFTGSLAQRLDGSARLTVQEAEHGACIEPSTALLAPGGRHLRVDAGGAVRITDEPAVGGLRPRADLTIEDAARVYKEALVLVVLTGMGKDSLTGADLVKSHGGLVLAEAESTCTVYGMPRAVVEAGLADDVLALPNLAAAIAEAAS